MRAAIYALALFAIPGAAVAQQFDLECPGTLQSGINEPPRPFMTRIRIDLDSNQFCFNECDRVQHLLSVTDSEIVLHESNEDTPRRERGARGAINRVTGEYRNYSIEVRPIPLFFDVRGACERRPFSGFPARRF